MKELNYGPDPEAVRRVYDRTGPDYGEASEAAREIFRRLIGRLDYFSIKPSAVLDLGCGTADSLRILKRRYRGSFLTGLDISMGMLRQSKTRLSVLKKTALVQADAHQLPYGDKSFDLIVSNLLLLFCPQPESVFREINRVLKPGGALLFTTLGPDSMKSLLDCMHRIDPASQRLAFVDMHDIGDVMMRAGLAQPVLDIEYLRLTYPTVPDMLTELRACGGANSAIGRRHGLMAPAKAREIRRALESESIDELNLEIIHGHAWKGRQNHEVPTLPERYIPIKIDSSV